MYHFYTLFLISFPASFLILVNVISGGSSSELTTFLQSGLLCDVKDRVARGCSEERAISSPGGGVRVPVSLIDCASLCQDEDMCIGASVNADNTLCYLHFPCNTGLSSDSSRAGDVSCSGDDPNAVGYMAKYCQHGTWDADSGACNCVRVTWGQRCDRFPASCQALIMSGYPNGVHRAVLDIDQDGNNKGIAVTCFIANIFHAVVVLANDGSGRADFNRTMDEYVKGFYKDDNNLWAGLETWHELRNASYVEMQLLVNYKSGDGRFRKFHNFLMNNADEDYLFRSDFSTTDGWGPNTYDTKVGNCMIPLVGTPFSSWDRDRDGDVTTNCAARAGSGWWYSNGCEIPCNLLGLGFGYPITSATPDHQRVSILGVDVEMQGEDIDSVMMLLSIPTGP